MKIIFTYLIILILAAGVGFFLFKSSKTPNTNLPGETITPLNQEHIPEGSSDHPAYNSNPPTSGWHWPAPAKCAVYDPNPEPDERYIHNLEHGAVWISYKSSVDQNTKAQLQDFEKRYDNIVVTVRDADDANIAVAAWGHLLKLDSYSESKIIEFINAFMDKGPERVSCVH